MEDDRNDLLSNPGTGFVGQPEGRSCGRGTVYTAFSILVALLLAGQAVTGYFIYQHQTQISKITKSTQELKLKSLTESLPHNPKPVGQLRMANMMPMVMMDPSDSSENEMKLTNSTEDQVKRVLMKENPLRKFPELKNSFMENVRSLKTRMDYNDWKEFEVWMHKWLLFRLAQNEAPDQKVKTKCQEEECNKGVHPGKFCPQCDEKGDYLPIQCFHSTGFCWCVYKNGTMIEGTEVRGRPDCTGKKTGFAIQGGRAVDKQASVI
uniref:CD74 molecule n=1 Tax=Salvator merianae TaxID=96440 RepID=A0A8D0DUH8_SALMN